MLGSYEIAHVRVVLCRWFVLELRKDTDEVETPARLHNNVVCRNMGFHFRPSQHEQVEVRTKAPEICLAGMLQAGFYMHKLS